MAMLITSFIPYNKVVVKNMRIKISQKEVSFSITNTDYVVAVYTATPNQVHKGYISRGKLYSYRALIINPLRPSG